MRECKGTKRKEERLVLALLPFRGVGGTGGEAKWRKRKGEKKEKKGEMGRGRRKKTVVVHLCKAKL